MKKVIITLICLVLAKAGQAQYTENTNDQVSFGFRAGYTNFNIAGKDVANLSDGGSHRSIASFFAGIEANTKIKPYFWLKHDVSVVGKGSVLQRLDDKDEVFESKLRSLYVEIAPVSPTLHFKGIELFAGPYVAVLLQASVQERAEDGRLYKSRLIYGDAKQDGGYMQKLDAGLLGGLSYRFWKGFSIEARYMYGLTPIIEHSDRPDGQLKIFNRGFSAGIGYRW